MAHCPDVPVCVRNIIYRLTCSIPCHGFNIVMSVFVEKIYVNKSRCTFFRDDGGISTSFDDNTISDDRLDGKLKHIRVCERKLIKNENVAMEDLLSIFSGLTDSWQWTYVYMGRGEKSTFETIGSGEHLVLHIG